MSAPTRLFLRFVLTVAVVWAMSTYYGTVFMVQGGITAYVVLGALITLLNILVRPVLEILTLPLKFFAHLLTIIIVNGLLLWLIQTISDNMDSVLSFHIQGGPLEWVIVAVILGFANWVMKELLKHKD